MATREVTLHRVEDALHDILGVSSILRKMMETENELGNGQWAFNILANTLDCAAMLITAEVLSDNKEACRG